MRASFVFDANLCTGCQACQLACVIENDLEPEASWRQVHTFNERRLPDVPLFHLSMACNHCAEPACLEACPALAYTTDAGTGAVLIDPDKCIGCRYCSWACPYDAPRFDAGRGVMTKCTFCNDRLHEGRQPACAELCPTGALRVEPLPEERITNDVEGFEPTSLRPAIRIVPISAGRREPPRPVSGIEIPPGMSLRPAAESKVRLDKEWSLAVFTYLAAVLFGSTVGALGGGPAIPAPLFLALAVGAMALGTAHLGRKTRAWRAILGFRTSWLSREIVFFSSFVAVEMLHLVIFPASAAWGAIAVALGLAALFSMDRVYRHAISRGPPMPHSAGVLLTGLFAAAVWAGRPAPIFVLGTAKLLLYAVRKIDRATNGLPVWWAVALPRVVAGFLVPAGIALSSTIPLGGAVGCLLLGELIDRAEFYAELDFPTPERRMASDLARRVRPA